MMSRQSTIYEYISLEEAMQLAEHNRSCGDCGLRYCHTIPESLQSNIQGYSECRTMDRM